MDRERIGTSNDTSNDTSNEDGDAARRRLVDAAGEKRRRRCYAGVPLRAGAIALALLGVAGSDAAAATLHVANTGFDAPSCGGELDPCRTISQAVRNAAAGDRLLVQPGVYGDVDGDGEFIAPGDEPASHDTGCKCLVYVDKPLTIVSAAGAGATILRGAVDRLFAVAIDAPGVVFGKRKAGFSVIGDPQHDGYGIWVGNAGSGARIEGNVFSRLENALFVAGNGSKVIGNRISQVFGQGIHAEGESIAILRNVVEQTGTLGGNDSAIHVVGTGNAGHRVQRNLVVGNLGIGIFADNGSGASAGDPHLIAKNLVVGNARAGIKVVLAAQSGSVSVTDNAIYNNDGEGGTNCGLMTLSVGPTIEASNNFWGAPGGPGADPKDDVCSAGAPPDVSPAAIAEPAIVAPPLR